MKTLKTITDTVIGCGGARTIYFALDENKQVYFGTWSYLKQEPITQTTYKRDNDVSICVTVRSDKIKLI